MHIIQYKACDYMWEDFHFHVELAHCGARQTWVLSYLDLWKKIKKFEHKNGVKLL